MEDHSANYLMHSSTCLVDIAMMIVVKMFSAKCML